MLVSLRIENFALVDRLDLTFGPGLNVLTGETGAGKSIILDALDIVLGGKITSRAIRTGASKTVLEASFQLSDRLQTWLSSAEIDLLDEPFLVCSRDISNAQGSLRSRSRVNGVLVNKQQMDSLRDRLVEITAQGQTLQLGQTARQRDWLDAFGGQSILALRQTVTEQFGRYQAAQQRLEQFRQNEQHCLQQIDMLKYQLQELQDADLNDPDEQTHLNNEYQRLSHSVELQQQSYQTYQLLYDHPQGGACMDLLGNATTTLQEMTAVDAQVQPILDLVREALAQVQEAGSQIHRYGERLETDPQRLEEVELRLQQLKQICRKYGPTLNDAIAHQIRIERELQSLTGDGQSIADLEADCTATLAVLTQTCSQLSALRQTAATALEARLVKELKPLAMEKVQFQVDLKPLEPTAHGADRIVFAFSPNPGEPLQPLAEIASGGEMSRFLLALKACFTQVDPVATLVFDEVDVGVSGRVTQAIAEKLHHLSQHHQVLCVTHQPIIAAMADRHFQVEKQVIGSKGKDSKIDANARTVVRIQHLDAAQRQQELANLAGGGTSDRTLAFAESLLTQAAQIRDRKPVLPKKLKSVLGNAHPEDDSKNFA
ncbi:MAG: DNA repair protein RecN [Acaryochloridaceae cyanobacterium RU_4_10]|nr:DNA repair protein RecN [Acaryochloridaceae cyanobacterium RU_4_10]